MSIPQQGGEAPAALPAGLVAGLCVALPAAAVLVALSPVAVTAALLGAIFAALSWRMPVTALGCYAFLQIALPIYAKLPAIGPIPPAPVAAAALAAIASMSFLAWLAGARFPPLAPVGRFAVRTFLFFAAVGLVSLSDDRTTLEGVGMWVKVFVFPGALMTVILLRLDGPQDVHRLFGFMLVAASAAALYGLLESILGYNPVLDMFEGHTDVVYFTSAELGSTLAYRAFSVYTQPIEYATCLAMIFPFAMISFVGAPTRRSRLLYAAGGTLCVLGLALTFSRGPMLAMLVSIVSIGVIYKPLRIWLAGFLLAGLLALVVSWPFLGAGISERLGDVDNVTLRFKLWQTAFALFRDHPLIGIGIGNFPEHYLDAAREHLIGPFFEFGAESVEQIRVAESTYLQLLAEMGLLGAAAALGLAAAFARLAATVWLRAPDRLSRDLAIACSTGAVAYLVSGLTITAYTHFVSTTILLGLLLPSALVLDRQTADS